MWGTRTLVKYSRALDLAEKRTRDYNIAKERKKNAKESGDLYLAKERKRRCKVAKELKEDADETVDRLGQQLAAGTQIIVHLPWQLDSVKTLREQTGWNGVVIFTTLNPGTRNKLVDKATQAELEYMIAPISQ